MLVVVFSVKVIRPLESNATLDDNLLIVKEL